MAIREKLTAISEQLRKQFANNSRVPNILSNFAHGSSLFLRTTGLYKKEGASYDDLEQ